MTEEKRYWEKIYDTYNEYKNTIFVVGTIASFIGLGYNIHRMNMKQRELERITIDCVEHFKDVALNQEMIVKYLQKQNRHRYRRA